MLNSSGRMPFNKIPVLCDQSLCATDFAEGFTEIFGMSRGPLEICKSRE